MTDIINKFIQTNLAICNMTAEGPWIFTPQSERDDWQLHDSEFTFFKQDDSGVPITESEGRFIVNSRTALPQALKALEIAVGFLREIEEKCHRDNSTAYTKASDALTEIEELLK